jgi:UDP-N-acetylmuramyl-tripeptide synthetase
VLVRNLTLDTRTLAPGDVFVALPGAEHDGRDFIEPALAAGAVAVLMESGRELHQDDARVIPISGLKGELGALANRLYGSPSRDLKVVAVTGTNGKTSVVDLTAQLLRRMGRKTGTIGTLGMRLDQERTETSSTTPDCLALQRQLRQWRDDGVECVTLEASSHALDQGRLDGLAVDVGVFTNLSRDHLDYHHSMDAYCEAKLKLFREFEPVSSIYNADDEAVVTHSDIWWSGGLGVSTRGAKTEIRIEVVQSMPQVLKLETPWGDGRLQTALSGRFNAFNVGASLAAALSLGADFAEALAAVEALEPVLGRLQAVGDGADIRVIVDYAHTPDALERAICALKETDNAGALWVLFGCGGDRDPGKRAEMGAIACQFADRVILTSDNPRSEAPEAIIADILRGCDGSPIVESDRAAAIALVIAEARVGDTVLIAGKGHETYQEIAGVRSPFNDAEHAAQHLQQRQAA